MPPGPPRRRRARPVADAPIDPLLLRLEDLAKGWLLALLELAPLDDAPAILAADLARDGPRICAAVVRSLASDEDLRRLEPGGALELLASRTGAIAGAGGTAATSQAVDALQSVIWSGLRDELPNPDPDLISELAERLGLVIELVRGAALRHAERGGGAPLSAAAPAVEVEVVPGPPPGGAPSGEPEPSEPEPPPAAAEGPRVVPPEPHPAAPPPAPEPPPAAPPPPPEPPPAAAAAPPPPAAAAPEALWIGAVDDEIGRSQQTGTPLSLLLVELDDADRVAAASPGEEATATFGRFAQAVRSALRRHDILACETDSRAWIIARDTSRFGAQALGSRVAGAVRAAQHWRGAPMMASVGVAVLGEDGEDRESLIEAAEEGRYAAAASGIAIVRATPSDRIDQAEGPPETGPDAAS